MPTENKIDLKELRIIITKILDNLEQEGHKDLTLSHDFYWDINSSEKYHPYKDPQNLTIGQLTEDLKTIKSLLNGEKAPIRYDLVWLAALLRYLGEKPSVPMLPEKNP